MQTRPELNPVVEAPSFSGTPPWPWRIASHQPFSFIRLCGEMPEASVGSVMAQLVAYNRLDAGPAVAVLAERVLMAESLLLPGGLQAIHGDREIDPGCCCGLEGWREWLECLETGASPWLGHDPAPWVEWVDETACVWSDGGLERVTGEFAIEFERRHLAEDLARVGRDLAGFLTRVESWAERVGWPGTPALCRKLDEAFRITLLPG
jgi:hypothetical protein